MQVIRGLLAAAALLAAMTGAQARELVVVESTAPDLPAGRIIDGSAPLSLKAGMRVALVADDGKVIKLEGPFIGTVSGGGAGGDRAVVAAISRLFDGGPAESASLGTFRGAGPQADGREASTADIFAIDIRRTGTQCAATGGLPTLWRAETGRETTVTLQQLPGGPGGLVRFPAGVATAAWPAAVPVADDGEYLVRDAGDAWSNTLRLRILPASVAEGASGVAWLADNGCASQARALLATLL